MEATKKTSTTKAALLVVAALSMLLSGLFIATASRSDASPPPACPDGFTLTADGKNCFQKAVTTSADNPNSCAEGSITPDGSKCYIPARLIPQEGVTYCPKGYSPDDSMGGMCARFEPASLLPDACPEGARGTAGGCYILVAKGPRGAAECEIAGGVVYGDICVVEQGLPTYGASTCPTGDATIINPGCYRIVSESPEVDNCDSTYVAVLDGEEEACRWMNPSPADTDECPAATATGATTPVEDRGVVTGYLDACEYPRVIVDPAACPNNSEEAADGCRVYVALVPGALGCPEGEALFGGKCWIYADLISDAPQCPIGSLTDSDGYCRKLVANAPAAYTCKDASAALNGKSCVYTAPFTVDPAPNAYKCDKGVRSVIGYGANMQVLCFLGNADANVTSGPSCLQGVLSTDNQYCLVPRIDTAPAVAAPIPAFTG